MDLEESLPIGGMGTGSANSKVLSLWEIWGPLVNVLILWRGPGKTVAGGTGLSLCSGE